jgi:hypothetical protein
MSALNGCRFPNRSTVTQLEIILVYQYTSAVRCEGFRVAGWLFRKAKACANAWLTPSDSETQSWSFRRGYPLRLSHLVTAFHPTCWFLNALDCGAPIVE